MSAVPDLPTLSAEDRKILVKQLTELQAEVKKDYDTIEKQAATISKLEGSLKIATDGLAQLRSQVATDESKIGSEELEQEASAKIKALQSTLAALKKRVPRPLGSGVKDQTYVDLVTVYTKTDGETVKNESKLPIFGLGTWLSDKGKVATAVEIAIANGYRHIDCALCYGNEDEVGQGLKKSFESGTVKRSDIFVTSKLWNTDHASEDVEPAVRETLAALGLEYLDLYLIHWPLTFKKRLGDSGTGGRFPKTEDNWMKYGRVVPHSETWSAMEELVRKGLVKHIGLSNFNAEQIDDIRSKASIMPSVLQVESHPFFQQRELIEYCIDKDIVFEVYSPLSNTSRPWATAEENERYNVFTNPTLNAIGKKYGKTAAQVCIRFQIERGLVVFPKSVTESRIIENSQVFDFELTAEDMSAISKLDCGFRGCNPSFDHPGGRRLPRDIFHPHYPFKSEFPEMAEELAGEMPSYIRKLIE